MKTDDETKLGDQSLQVVFGYFCLWGPLFQEPNFPHFPSGDIQMSLSMYPSCEPGVVPMHNHEEGDHGPGIYAVPVLPFMGPMLGCSANNLIPLTYNIPMQTNPAGADSEENNQEAEHQHEPQRRVVRRFQFAIQIDLGLILKLAAVVFLFHQEGSRQRLITLLLSALLIYLYQTGALAPILRWLRRVGAPPQQQAAVRPENAPAVVQNDAYERQPENVGAENQNQPLENGRQIGNENREEVERPNGVAWWEIAREIKTVIVGFVVSLFPGFHHHDD